MKPRIRTWTMIAFAVCLVIGVSATHADANATISGTGPFTITQNTDLGGDVDCSTVTTVDCITFAAPNLQLNLNGFTITGPKPTPCTDAVGPAGINTNGQAEARIEGSGKVEKFRFGIQVIGGDKSQVRKIVAIRNCVEGIHVAANKVQIEDNIVLNTVNPTGSGIAIDVIGDDNSIQRNEVHGNLMANGISVTGTRNNIERNSVTTNLAGIVLFSGTLSNRVDENLVLNNKPSVDIFDGGVNNIVTQNNVCERGSGAAATVCANSPTPPFLILHGVGQ